MWSYPLDKALISQRIFNLMALASHSCSLAIFSVGHFPTESLQPMPAPLPQHTLSLSFLVFLHSIDCLTIQYIPNVSNCQSFVCVTCASIYLCMWVWVHMYDETCIKITGQCMMLFLAFHLVLSQCLIVFPHLCQVNTLHVSS